MLKKLNFIISTIFPQKLYWHLAGLIHPWSSVLEGINKPVDLYQQSDNLVKLLKKLKLVNKNTEVLDIGCGVGRLEYRLAEDVKFCVGIDIAPSMVDLAKKYITADNVEFLTGNGKSLKNLGDRRFDLIFSIIVFQHLPREILKNYIKESYQYLKNGGKLFFQIPVFSKVKLPEPPRNHPWAVRSYHLDELKKILQTTGYKNIAFYDVSGNKFKNQENQIFVLAEKRVFSNTFFQ